MNNNFEEEMLSPERKEEIARQNLSKIEEVTSQTRTTIYDKDQGNIPMPSQKPPNEFEAYQMVKGENVNQPQKPNRRVEKFVDNDGNVIEVDDQTNTHNFGMPKVGYYFIPDKLLPSEGAFYPPGYSIAYRSANSKEMLHYGTTETGDYNEFSAALNYMLQHCCEVKMNNKGTSSHLDLLEFDRIYLLFCIRGITMPEGTPPFTMPHDCPCGYVNEVIVSKDTINKMDWNIPIGDDPEKTLARYYNAEKRCFDIKTKDNMNNMTLYVPTIGTVSKILKHVKREMYKKKNINIDNVDIFKEYSKLYYMVPDHKLLIEDNKGNIPYLKRLMLERNNWSLTKMQIFISLTDIIETACTPSIKYVCKSCGEEVSADIMFHEGYKSVFINKSTDISDKLS